MTEIQNIRIMCACQKSITFSMGAMVVVSAGVEKLDLEVFHDRTLIYKAWIGGTDFIEKAPISKIGHSLAANILSAMRKNAMPVTCRMMMKDAVNVLRILENEDAAVRG